VNAPNDKIANASTDSIAVIKAQLPYIDRRALSQAWFSAFHLATGASATAEVHLTAAQAAAAEAPQAPPLAQRRHLPTTQALAPGGRPAYARRSTDVCAPEAAEAPTRRRGRPAPQLAAAERSAPLQASIVQATFTLAVDDARVAIHVRHEEGKLRVIALCSARHVDIVQRALAKTALAMRARGTAIDTLVQSSDEEARA